MCNKNKNQLFIIFNTLVPLCLGLAIYIFMKSGTYINTFLEFDFHYNPKTIVGVFIVNWFCDFLWSYALVFALYFVLSPFKKRLLLSCLLSVVLGHILEILQYANILSGTFDWWDIAIELIAVIMAMTIINKTNKKDGS